MKTNSRILKHMGVKKWFSRFQMPGAAKSVLLEETTEQPSSEIITQVQASHQSPASHQAQATSNITDISKLVGKPNQKTNALNPQTLNTKQSSEDTQKQSTKSKVPNFRFQAICINDFFCFVPITSDIAQTISQTQINFLQNIIFAKSSTRPQIKQQFAYQWPLFQHDRAEQGITTAQNFFKEQILTHQHELEFQQVWIFGNLLEKLEMQSSQLKEHLNDCNILTLPTLEQSMRSAESKKSLWQLIK